MTLSPSLKKAKRRKPRRVVLGVGHPWFFSKAQGVMYDALYLTEGSGTGDSVPFTFRNVGNWNQVRLVLEILK